MYIPFGPSKKDLYKIIIGLLILFYCLFLGMFKPKALTIQNAVGYRNGTSYALSGGNGSYADIAIKYYGGNQLDGVEKLSFYIEPNATEQQYKYMSGFIRFEDSTGVVPNVPIIQLSGNSCELEHSMSLGTSYVAFTCPMSGGWIDFLNLPVLLTSFYIQRNFGVSDIINNSSTLNEINTNVTNISDNLNDSSIDSSSANNLTNNSAFQDNNGLDAIIKAPLIFIQSLTSSTCSSISLTIPYIDANVSLPCMSTIYNKALGQQLVNLIALVINGVVLYRYCLKILELVHNAKNPNKDELEVLDL